jgi:hypothetical protein
LAREVGVVPSAISRHLWSPGIAFRAWHGKEAATIIVCLECNSLLIEYRGAEGKGHGRIAMDLDMNRDAFAHLAQQAFPSDEAFKHLERD